MKTVTLALALFLLSGCALFRGTPSIRAGDATVTGVKDAGKPATLNTTQAGETLAIPAGSKITVTKTEATPERPAQDGKPAVAAQPEKTVTVIEPSADTAWTKTESKVQANTGTVDTSVAQHRIDVEERRWLLWAAIGCGIGGLVIRSMLPAWPALSNGLLIGAVFALAAWKLADIPSWIWAAVIGAVVLMALGYKRAEWDKDGDGIPDFLERRKESRATTKKDTDAITETTTHA